VKRLWRPRALPGASLCIRGQRLRSDRLHSIPDHRLLTSNFWNKGGAGGVEPLTSAFTEPRAIRYTTGRIVRVIPGGFEPPISSVSGRRRKPLGHRIVSSSDKSGVRKNALPVLLIPISCLLKRRRGRDSNPHALAGARVSTAARPAVSGSRPFQWNRGELNPVAVLARHSSRPRAIPCSEDREQRSEIRKQTGESDF
jgi:hypothetical protein